MADEDDLTPEEIAAFEGAGEDEIKSVERFIKWRDRAARTTKAPERKNPSSESSGPPELTLKQLRELTTDPHNRSVLKHLIAELDLPPPENPPGKKPAKPPSNETKKLFGNLRVL